MFLCFKWPLLCAIMSVPGHADLHGGYGRDGANPAQQLPKPLSLSLSLKHNQTSLNWISENMFSAVL